MNCQYCNHQLPPGAATCPSCGADVPGGAAANLPAADLQGPGFRFQLQPGEQLISQGSMQQIVFPALCTYMRLTDRRLVFCDISRWLTIGLSFWFCFSKSATISRSFTREDIASMEFKSCGFGKNKIVIIDRAGNKFQYAGLWFSNRLVQNIMSWWQSGR